VHVDDRVPLLLRHVRQHAVTQDAGVVDDGVEIAERLDRSVDESLRTFPRRHAVAVGHGLATHPLDLLDDLLGGTEVATGAVDVATEIVDHDLGAVRRQAQGMLTADPAPGTGHDGNSTLAKLAHAH
jgi:hypothetical protein